MLVVLGIAAVLYINLRGKTFWRMFDNLSQGEASRQWQTLTL